MPSAEEQPQTRYCHNSRTTLRWIRRGVQLLFFGLWVALFLLARGDPGFVVRTELFLIADPLVAAATMGAARLFVPLLLVSLVLVLLTLVAGRVFCGWLCPMGTLLDATAKVLRPREDRIGEQTHQRMQRWKYYLLAVFAAGALLSAQWVYLLDPLVLLFRGVAAGLYPVGLAALPRDTLPEALQASYHGVAALPLALLVVVLGLTAITPRFFCRYLCPLGALYGLLARAPMLRRRVKGCDACRPLGTSKQCVSGCRMGAVPSNPHLTRNHECVRCFSGRSFCHVEAIRFDWTAPKPVERQDRALALDRRAFLVNGAMGLGLAPLVARSAFHRADPNLIVRPPRVLDEDTFADQCVRCGMCVQACPTQTLQLTHLEAGLAGLWTPAITPRVGGCKADCNACGEVCPTNAIPRFDKVETEKWVVKMGTAVLEPGRCISYGAQPKACRKCIDICPTKALIIEPARAGHPLRPAGVDYVRCIGCGLCEYACRKIVFGRPAIVNFAHGRGQPSVLREQPTKGFEARVLE